MDDVVNDPVIARRARIARAARTGKKVGYLALLAAVVAFTVGLATDWPQWAVTVTVAGLVAACCILPLPIVLAYGVRAADREDRAAGREHR